MSTTWSKVFIDTSVIIRFFTKDDPVKFEGCVNMFELVEEGKIRPYISNIVILEVEYVLRSIYSFSHDDVVHAIKALVSL